MDTLSCILFEMVFQGGCVEERKRFLGRENRINKNMAQKKDDMAIFREE